ncbi:MAG: HNH endonuclease [Bdellovibrionales bacterium]|nr:HNH endonuclease [Bdellovibrionales bacterium]
MNLIRALKDSELLSSIKALAQRECALTLEVLKHLQEIERRKLYSPHYPSLFEYAVRELSYSEASAGRRIQAMRAMTEIPELASKIESGALSLTNICQAQSFFREIKKAQPELTMTHEQKTEVLAKLEDKSSREGLKVLLEISPVEALPRERERMITPDHVEVTFLLNTQTKNQLNEVRSLLGPQGSTLSLAQLVSEMAKLSSQALKEKRFGKQRARATVAGSGAGVETAKPGAGETVRERTRYISQATKHAVWQAAGGKCAGCGSTHRLQFDHVRPFALGGDSAPENLQLLCGSCNLRRGIAAFGPAVMRRG